MNDSDFAQVRSDHYAHWAALIFIALTAATHFGWWIGIGVFVGLLAVISITNTIIMLTVANFTALRLNRWGWLIVAAIVIIVCAQ